jgi:hypothetical protein
MDAFILVWSGRRRVSARTRVTKRLMQAGDHVFGQERLL